MDNLFSAESAGIDSHGNRMAVSADLTLSKFSNRPLHSFGDNTCKEGSVLGLSNNRMSTKEFEVRTDCVQTKTMYAYIATSSPKEP